MATDYLSLSCVPCDEEWPTGPDVTSDQQRGTLVRYLNQLRHRFPVPEGVRARFKIKSFPHDFGSYEEVCVLFDDDQLEAGSFAYFCDANCPARWDDEQVLVFDPKAEQEEAANEPVCLDDPGTGAVYNCSSLGCAVHGKRNREM